MAKLPDDKFFDLTGDFKFGIIGKDGSFVPSSPSEARIAHDLTGSSEVVSVGASIVSFTMDLTGTEALPIVNMLMPPWGHVEFSPKDGKPAARAMVSTQEDARRMLDGETIEVMWQRFENDEWVNVERAPLQISLPQQYVWELPTTIPFRPDRVVFGSKADADGFLTGETVPGTWQKFDGKNRIDQWRGMFRFNK